MNTQLEETRRSGLIGLLKNTGWDVTAEEDAKSITLTATKEFTPGHTLTLRVLINRPAKRLAFFGHATTTTTSTGGHRDHYLRSHEEIENFIKGHWING